MKLEDEILISAYLDGELAGDELQRVEKLLEGNAEARQLADELRAVRTRLQALPRFGLPADFAEQTARRAEQELAAARAVDAAVGTAAPLKGQPGGDNSPSTPSIWTTWRGFAWAAVALAAALMLTIYPLAQREPQVAYTTANKAATSQVRAKDVADEPQSSAASRSEPASEVIDHSAGAERFGSSPKRSFADVPPTEGESRPDKINAPAAFRAAPVVADQLAPEQTAPPDAGTGYADRARGLTAAEAVRLDQDGLTVVSLNITPEAAKRKEFDRLLSKHLIAISDDNAEEQRGGQSLRSGKESGGLLNSTDGTSKTAVSGQAPDADRLEAWLADPQGDRELDVVLVEASPEQLAATIEDLASSDSFSAISVSKSVPVIKSPAQKKTEEKASLQAPAERSIDLGIENEDASELFRKSAGGDKKDAPADGRKEKPTDPTDRSGAAAPAGRATRLAIPAEKPMDESSPSVETSPPPPAPAAEPGAATSSPAPADAEQLRRENVPQRDKQRLTQRVLFVLRTSEPAPPASQPPPK